MADERDEAAEKPGRDEATRPMSVDESTSAFDPFDDESTSGFDPFADDEEAAGEADPASTQAMPQDPGSTQAMPQDAGSTQAMPAGLESTRAMPVNGDPTAPEPGVWTARASVPVNAEPAPDPEVARWEEVDDESAGRSWLRPVLIGLVVLVLLAMLGTGLWLIINHLGGRPTPTTVVPATTSAVPTSTRTAPATQVPTAPTGTAPTVATPAQITVPDVVGQSEAAAKQQLASYGLTFNVVRRATGGSAPGTVIATDPGAGTTVAAGSRVTLIVAAAPVSTPTATPGHSPSPTTTRSAPPSKGATEQ